MNTIDTDTLKAILPMPGLLARMGLGEYAKSSCRSPFRDDKSPSWGIFKSQGAWFFKDHATGDSGDEITLLARWKGLDAKCDFPKVFSLYAALAGQPTQPIKTVGSPGHPDSSGFHVGTAEQLKRLAVLRPYGLEGLVWASARGLLVFGNWHGQECYGVTDSSGRVLEIRRMDGKHFPAVQSANLHERKSHALKGSEKAWPVGILEAQDHAAIALVEGIPDFLEAHYLALWEQSSSRDARDVHCAPVAMLSGSPSIAEDAIPYFRGKHVRIFGHADEAGQRGAKKWASQLHGVAHQVEEYNLNGLRKKDGVPIKDLYDLRDLNPTEYLHNDLWKILP